MLPSPICSSYSQLRVVRGLLVGEAVADQSVQACRVATVGVPGELSGSARCRPVVGRHHSVVRCRLLR